MTVRILNSKTLFKYAACAIAALLLSGCGRSSVPEESQPTATVLGDAIGVVANLDNDVLIPPEAPQLSITLVDSSLDFHWQAAPDTTSVKLFAYDASSEIESLISDTIATTADTYSTPITLFQSRLDDIAYRIELCDPNDCVSSYYQSLSKPVSSTPVSTLGDNSHTQWQPYLNKTGNLLVALDADAKQAEIHFKVGSSWFNASTVHLTTLSDSIASDVAISDTGDTFVVATYQPINSRISISAFDRLGEAWFETSQWELPFQTDESLLADKIIRIAGDASAIIVRSEHGWVSYNRNNFDFSRHIEHRIPGNLISWDVSSDLSQLGWISEASGGKLAIHKKAVASSAYDTTVLPYSLAPLLAKNAKIQINNAADEWLLAGWQTNENLRFSLQMVHFAFTENTTKLLSTRTVTGASSKPGSIDLGSSDNLEVSYISGGDEPTQATQLYHIGKTGLSRSFSVSDYIELSSNTPIFALSGDGSTLSWASNEIHTLQ